MHFGLGVGTSIGSVGCDYTCSVPEWDEEWVTASCYSIDDCSRNAAFVVYNLLDAASALLSIFIKAMCLRAGGSPQCARSVQYVACLFREIRRSRRSRGDFQRRWAFFVPRQSARQPKLCKDVTGKLHVVSA